MKKKENGIKHGSPKPSRPRLSGPVRLQQPLFQDYFWGSYGLQALGSRFGTKEADGQKERWTSSPWGKFGIKEISTDFGL